MMPPPSNPPSAASDASRQRRTLLLVFILSAVVIFTGSGYLAYHARGWFADLFSSTVDQTQATFEVREGRSIYRNPKYGLRVELPGVWQQLQARHNFFCVLSRDDGISAVVVSAPTGWMTSLDSYENSLREQLLASGGYTFEKHTRTQVGGRDAWLTLMRIHHGEGKDYRQALLSVKKGTRIYALIVTTQGETEQSWLRLLEILPDSLQFE